MAINVTLKDTSGSEEKILYPQTLWGNVEDKPSWLTTLESNGVFSGNYTDLSYGTAATQTASSTTVSIAGTTPQHIISFSSPITGVTLSANPVVGHSCHVMFVNTDSSDQTVEITHDNTNGSGVRICPNAKNLILTVKSGGYAEVDFLNISNKIYVRGV